MYQPLGGILFFRAGFAIAPFRSLTQRVTPGHTNPSLQLTSQSQCSSVTLQAPRLILLQIGTLLRDEVHRTEQMNIDNNELENNSIV